MVTTSSNGEKVFLEGRPYFPECRVIFPTRPPDKPAGVFANQPRDVKPASGGKFRRAVPNLPTNSGKFRLPRPRFQRGRHEAALIKDHTREH
ncbi:MAG: hypothetical protein CMJ81_03935 [Planctomycetaceae bacterium]|nr:hypothetical protein [Planctomycetaceae bacterium]MBP60477.1 hypothetical protein [Planctomycetaceae bacterium]